VGRGAGELGAGGAPTAKAAGKLQFAIEPRINSLIILVKKPRDGLLSSAMQKSDEFR
jgi:hypothetical protein